MKAGQRKSMIAELEKIDQSLAFLEGELLLEDKANYSVPQIFLRIARNAIGAAVEVLGRIR